LLSDLYCQNNDLTSLNVDANAELRCLSCVGNSLTELDIRNCPQLLSCFFFGYSGLLEFDSGVTLTDISKSKKVLIMPEDLTHIESEAFMGESVNAVALNFDVKSIGDRAFANNPHLMAVDLSWVEAPPVMGNDLFNGASEYFFVIIGSDELETWAQTQGYKYLWY